MTGMEGFRFLLSHFPFFSSLSLSLLFSISVYIPPARTQKLVLSSIYTVDGTMNHIHLRKKKVNNNNNNNNKKQQQSTCTNINYLNS